jgi:hypothetical protein
VEVGEFLVWEKLFGTPFCVTEVCTALVADPDVAEHLRNVKSTGTDLESSKLFSPEKKLYCYLMLTFRRIEMIRSAIVFTSSVI